MKYMSLCSFFDNLEASISNLKLIEKRLHLIESLVEHYALSGNFVFFVL